MDCPKSSLFNKHLDSRNDGEGVDFHALDFAKAQDLIARNDKKPTPKPLRKGGGKSMLAMTNKSLVFPHIF
ncbi:hypothetical protein [Helicobacter sp. T3_23-1059]